MSTTPRPKPQIGPEIAEHNQLFERPVGVFHDDMVGMERVEVVDQLVPAAPLYRLAAIVAESTDAPPACL